MPAIHQERLHPIDSLLGDSKEEVLGIHVLINKMHPPFLMGHAFALTSFNKTRIRMLPLLSLYSNEGVMDILDMDA